jgi:hypothetical protein
VASIRFETTPSAPSWHAWGSFSRMPGLAPAAAPKRGLSVQEWEIAQILAIKGAEDRGSSGQLLEP